MQETSGGRVALELVSVGDAETIYAATLRTPDAAWSAKAHIRQADGQVDFDAWSPGAPPAWLEHYARTFLRSAWREAHKDVPWPQRLGRWRPAPAS